MESSREPTRRRIIVIDHDDDSRLLLSELLRTMGFEVLDEDNGVSGLARIACERTHTHSMGLIVELNMPVLGGMAIVQEIQDRYPDIPVIVMSHAKAIARLRQAVKLGAQEYLIKPIDPVLFGRKCRDVFRSTSGLS